jgi:hypothetical protein
MACFRAPHPATLLMIGGEYEDGAHQGPSAPSVIRQFKSKRRSKPTLRDQFTFPRIALKSSPLSVAIKE